MSFVCASRNLHSIIQRLKKAEAEGNTTQIARLRQELELFRSQCGTPYTDEEIEKLLLQPSSDNIAYVKNAHKLIIRSIEAGDIETAQTLLNDVKRLLRKEESRATISSFRVFDQSRLPETCSAKCSYINCPWHTVQEGEKCRQKLPPMNRSISFQRAWKPDHPRFPNVCSKACPHTQCSSWGTPETVGKPCRNRVKTNEELYGTNSAITKYRTLDPNSRR